MMFFNFFINYEISHNKMLLFAAMFYKKYPPFDNKCQKVKIFLYFYVKNLIYLFIYFLKTSCSAVPQRQYKS